MSVESDSDGPKSSAVLNIETVSPRGPFARGVLYLPASNAPIRNLFQRRIVVAAARVSPLVVERTGLSVKDGALDARVAPGPLAPGEAAMATVFGSAPARPGVYAANLDLCCDDETILSTPVRVNVAANAAWGVGCMLFGLLALGILKLLTGSGDVENAKREAYLDRSDIHDMFQHDPPPEKMAGVSAEIDRNFDKALGYLAETRGFSIVDRRIADADKALAAGREAARNLRKAMADAPRGGAEAAELKKDWSDFQNFLKNFAGRDLSVTAAGTGLGGHAAALVSKAKDQLLGLPIKFVSSDLEVQFNRLELARTSGDIDRTRQMALATRAWLRRAAKDLERRLTLVEGLELAAGDIGLSDAQVRKLIASDDLPPEQRQELLRRLDAADAGMVAGASLEDLKIAHQRVEETETEAMRARKNVLLPRVRAAVEAAGEEMSIDAVDAEFRKARAVEHPTAAQKADTVVKALEVWRSQLGVVRDADARARMEAAIDRAVAAAGRLDLEGMLQGLHEMEHEWQAYLPRHVATATIPVVAPVCSDWRDRALQEAAMAQAAVKRQGDRPEVAAWERSLDHAQRALSKLNPDTESCIEEVNKSDREVMEVSQAAFTQALADVPIPPKAQLDIAESSGVAAAAALIKQLASAPRDLQLTPRTSEEDRVAGQPIVFTLNNLNPNWGTSIAVTVDWGDPTSAPLATDAEKIRQGELEHTYGKAGGYHPKVTALDGGSEVGSTGTTDLLVKLSPASTAERLADIFLTSQFGLALLIASIVYFWRFRAGSMVFGSNGFHYVQAFSLGFAAYAAVTELPKILAEMAFK